MDEHLIPLLERIASALERIADADSLAPAQPGPAAATGQPTFAGFTASWTVDAAGYPSYIATVDGELAYKHERQGDVWWSVKDDTADGGYRRILTIKSGETLPPEAQWRPAATPGEAKSRGVVGPGGGEKALRTAPVRSNPGDPNQNGAKVPNPGQRAAQAPQAEQSKPQSSPPDPGNPFTEIGPELQKSIHAAGRQLYGNGWQASGPQLVLSYTDGRTGRSGEMSTDEGLALLDFLKGDLERTKQNGVKSAEYAG